MSTTTLVVFCRRPALGVGKRRLAVDLGDAATLELAEHLLAAALEDAAGWPGEVVLAPADGGDVEWAEGLLDRPCRVIPQPDGNLGQRIAEVDRAVRAGGVEQVVFIGSDAPLLRPDDLGAAREALDRFDVVLGPAEDGGVTLMGSRRPWPRLSELPWSTGELAAALGATCHDAGLTVTRVRGRADVDAVSDLSRLYCGLAGDERPARRGLRAWLARRPEARTVSVVIPILGDVPELHRLLDLLGEPSDAFEVIVVDAANDPACRKLCEQEGARCIGTRAGRGHQLRVGAEHARGLVLWFLHADAEPPPGAVELLRTVVAGGAAGGCFRFRFAGTATWTKRCLAALVGVRNRTGGIPYGDQGLFFAREAYMAAGGFADQPLFEEVPLVKAVRREGRFRVLPEAIGVSPRRWERDGWLRRTLENRLLALGYALGVSPRTLAGYYRPMRDRRGEDR